MIRVLLTAILVVTGCAKQQTPVMTTTYRTLDYVTVQQHTAVIVLQRMDFDIKSADNATIVSKKLRHSTGHYESFDLWVVINFAQKIIKVYCEPTELCQNGNGEVNANLVKDMLKVALDDTDTLIKF